MDGVIYRANQLIPGAKQFVNALIENGSPFVFLTNNSSPTPEDLSVRLGHLGLPGVSPRHFYSSALNTAEFLSETHPACTVFVIGEGGLLAALHERKIASDTIQPSYVVVGEGAVSMAPGSWPPTRTIGVRCPATAPAREPAPRLHSWRPAQVGAPTTSANPTATCSTALSASSQIWWVGPARRTLL
jgi:hypothetical protein